MSGAWSALAGYDPALVARLPERQRADLSLVSVAWCWAALGLAAPMAYVAALLTHSFWLSLAVALGVLAMLLQLVRLTVAGGGMSLDSADGRAYRPGRAPLLWLALLGALFALPAQLPLWHHTHARLVADERASLLAMHQRAMAATPAVASRDRYAHELVRCEFVVLRLKALLQQPAQAGRYGSVYLLLLLAPMMFARTQARSTLRAYDELKAAQARRLIARDAEATRRTLESMLARYPSHAPRGEQALALAMRWPVPAPPARPRARS
jgi:hypothetical protein